MADKTNRRRTDDVYWSNIAMESGEDDAYIPGLSAPGNKRPGRIHAKKMEEVKARIPSHQPVIESGPQTLHTTRNGSYDPRKGKPKKPVLNKQRDKQQSFPLQERFISREDSGMSTTFESFAEKSIHRLRQASLKDLRPEDKQRVANLIKELARVGEEKEKAVKELHGERQQYEQQVMKMVHQQENILKEREDIQEKLFQCQKLLTEYQNQLLNKQDQLNSSICEMREDEYLEHQNSQRQSRHRQTTTQAANQKRDDKHSTNQDKADNYVDKDESVSDLLMNPADNIKRPYTSMIDKEIARERSRSRSLSQGSRGSSCSRPRSVSPSEGRPKFAYPSNINGIGPLREPLASSTQKSMEIVSQCENETFKSRISAIGQGHHRVGHVTGQTLDDSEKVKSKVVFNDKEEYNDSATVHSPNLKSASQMFSDPAYASYYKKLSPGGRKKELLKQRQALLDEQERLRKVLEKQEQQLSHRKYEYDKRIELQKQRMDFYKQGGMFPALKLDFESGSDKGSASVEDKGAVLTGHSSHAEMYSPPPTDDIQIDNDIQVKSCVSMGTSPMSTPPHGNKVTMATSPNLSEHSDESDDGRKLVDVATSISYRTPTKDNGDKLQGNLTLGYNRKGLDVHVSVPPTPGEKTLNVLELVNSMEEEPFSPHQPIRNVESVKQPMRKQEHVIQPIMDDDDQENRPIKAYTPNKYITYQKAHELNSYKQKPDTASRKVLHGKRLNDDEESMEENQILEDIFFL